MFEESNESGQTARSVRKRSATSLLGFGSVHPNLGKP